MKYRKPTFVPLLILSCSLACSGLQTLPAHSLSLTKNHHSQKEAMIDQAIVFDLPVMQSYVHPSKMFSFEAPAQWDVKNLDSGVVIYSPATVIFSASVIRTGYRLSTLSFIELVSNTENIFDEDVDQYKEIYRREDRPGRMVLVEKTYIDAGIKKLVTTMYRQVDEAVYIVEMSGNKVEILSNPNYTSLFLAFNDSIQDQQPVNLEPLTYTSLWTFSDPAHFSMNVPIGWKLQTDHSEENITNIQFRSPDDNAIIESIFWDYGNIVELDIAAEYALEILGTSYAKSRDDIKITSEIILDDGKSERITWVSRSGEYSGVTFFEIHNKNQVFILSQIWNRLFEDIYSPVTETAVLSFNSNSSFK